jgi:cellulose 1,4-beta-cellobiosidase
MENAVFGPKIVIGSRARCSAEGIRTKVIVVCVLLYSIIPLRAAQASLFCGRYDSIDVLGGEYRINSNVWGSTPGEQCIEASSDSTYFSVTHSTHNSSDVVAYPFIFKGCHWGSCTQNSGMPLKVGEMATTHFSWIIDTNSAGGTWNASYESWFSTAGGTAPDAAELMIWINYAGGANPAGSKVATVSIGGADWDVYFANWSHTTGWYYIAYKKTVPATSVDLDLKEFVDDAVARGYIDTDWYLDNMEAGFEIWRGGEGLTTNYFFASVRYNLPAVSITSPSDGNIFTEGADITIRANASDGDGNVTKVEFYQDSTKLGEAAVPPYSYVWQSIPAGDFNLTAIATDNHGYTNTSSAVRITVTGAGGSGRILREWWTGVPGDAVNDLTSNANYPDNPTGRGVLASTEGPTDWANNYGTRIRGYLHPITTGDYTFWIAGNANSELRLSTDAEPNNASLIAETPGWTDSREWDKYPQQRSLQISLAGGQKYYIEVLHKAGSGSDNVAAAWEGPGLNRQIIHGLFLSPCLINFNTIIQKGTVKAGKTARLDSIICSGTFGATSEMFDNTDSVTVQIYSAAEDYLVYEQTLSTNSFTSSKNAHTYKSKVKSGRPGGITLLKFDVSKNKFDLKAENVDLTGLGCPMYLLIDLGTYAALGVADENTVNGKKLLPIRLMSGYAETLAVTKARLKTSASPNSDQLSVKGTFTVDDDSNVTTGLIITWGEQTFTIPGNQFIQVKTDRWKANYLAPDGSIINADFDFAKCDFTVEIKQTQIESQQGTVNFNLAFGNYTKTAEARI